MLHELMDLRSCLFKTKQVDSVSSYDRKLEIIQRSLYGVDLDPFAVNIARLRLWLSLAVEFEGEKPEPLPNLKFEIEEGDSVSAPGPQPSQGLMRDAAVREFAETKALYIKAHGEKKKRLEAQVIDLKRSIATWTHGSDSVAGFDWPVEFAEVFHEGGFDVVVANPPYVRQELIKELKPTLRAVFPEVYMGTADLFVYFYARAIQVLKNNGMLVFISSNKWFRANYGSPLRKHISEACEVISITDFGDLPVFKSATAYPMIFVARKGQQSTTSTLFTHVPNLGDPYPNVKVVIERNGRTLPLDAIRGETWMLSGEATAALFEKAMKAGPPLREYTKSKIYRGLLTGCNEAFVLDGDERKHLVSQDRRSARLIKPLARGKDIRKWQVNLKDQWLIVTPIGVPIKEYPAVYAHLRKFQAQLEQRGDQGNHWWELRSCDYYSAFEQPKIMFPDIAKNLRFAFDASGIYSNNTAYFVPTDDLYLLGVLNSSVVEDLYLEISSQIRGGYLRFFTQYVETIPIPVATTSQRSSIERLVKRCIETPEEDRAQVESEINEYVAALYGIDTQDLTSSRSDGDGPKRKTRP